MLLNLRLMATTNMTSELEQIASRITEIRFARNSRLRERGDELAAAEGLTPPGSESNFDSGAWEMRSIGPRP